jgi:hypothetical protein
MARKKEIAALREALKRTDALIAAANDERSTCAVFDPHGEFTEEQKRAVRLYVDSWIREPLAAALAGIEGERDWSTESYLDGVHTGRW